MSSKLNMDNLKFIIDKYKSEFDDRWNQEKYKWEAIKHFQENWDVGAEDFAEMLSRSLAKTYNLLVSMNNFPRRMIESYAKNDPEAVRAMFIRLFDEKVDVAERILRFGSDAESICEQQTPGKQHYQRPMAISVYLWMRYPDKYYIYKYSVCKTACNYLKYDFVPKKGQTASSVKGNIRFLDSIAECVSQDSEFISLFEKAKDENSYSDPMFKTLAFDVAVYIYHYLSKKKEEKQDVWFPENYEPGISKDQWVDILKSEDVACERYMDVLRCMKDIGGQATCKQLAAKYGDTMEFYRNYSSGFAKLVSQKTGCKPYVNDKGTNKWWTIPYLGKDAGKDEDGVFIWKLRPELSDALDIVLADAEAYEEIEETESEKVEIELETYLKEDFLSEVYMSEDRYDTLKELLFKKKNIILQGAPGVGKTFAAKRLAYSIIGQKDTEKIEFVQFHQNYSYEDFIMGYKPDGEGFTLKEGIFYRFCKKAASDLGNRYFFIIDEINRGNMSKIFGELLMLIENNYRGTEMTLAYSGSRFSVPENLYIIGMMNTADRSLAMIDYALRRRFSFFSMEPGFDSDGFTQYKEALANDTFNLLIEKIIDLNIEISKDSSLGKGFCIGHSYFCGEEFASDEWMESVVNYDIIPMLEEYWFDDQNKLQKWQNILLGVFND